MIHLHFTPYRFKSALLCILGAGILTAACSKTEPQHDTVYIFYSFDLSPLRNIDQIRRSADSTQVRNIIFAPGTEYRDEWSGYPMNMMLKYDIQPAFDAANGKGIGRGTFKNVSDTDYNRAVEPQYNALGYKFEYSAVPRQ